MIAVESIKQQARTNKSPAQTNNEQQNERFTIIEVNEPPIPRKSFHGCRLQNIELMKRQERFTEFQNYIHNEN